MEKDRGFYFLALQKVEGIGSVGARRLIELFGSPKEVLRAKEKELLQVRGLGPRLVRNLKSKEVYRLAETEMNTIEKSNVGLICLTDSEYPRHLLECPDAPILLFSRGNPDLTNRRIVSIVGTRKMTTQGESFMHRFFSELVAYDPIVVSGLAYGVDICAHRLSLKHGLITVGVLAHGMDRIYPRAHYNTALEMIREGALLTEFWMGSLPEKENFVKRNRIIAGLSEATIVIESSGKGGSLITADLASSYHREVFAVPGRSADHCSTGCNHLIKTNKALMLTQAKDLEYMLNWQPTRVSKLNRGSNLYELSDDDEKKVFEILKARGRLHADQIALECEMEVKLLFPALLRLELKGAIRELSGKYFEAIL
jgi:DNA processing protein